MDAIELKQAARFWILLCRGLASRPVSYLSDVERRVGTVAAGEPLDGRTKTEFAQNGFEMPPRRINSHICCPQTQLAPYLPLVCK